MAERFFWGIDCGSTMIKVVLCDGDRRVLQKTMAKTLFPLIDHVRLALGSREFPQSPFEDGSEEDTVKENHRITVTGCGRNHVHFAQHRLTEIKAHFRAAKDQVGSDEPFTLIDIGGQDAKIIEARNGEIQDFVINRKCAAGTGAFIDELAHRLELNTNDLSRLARAYDKELTLSSFCTVFAVQEMIQILVSGERVENMVHALYASLVRRVVGMGRIQTEKVIFSGGVITHHPVLLELFQKKLGNKELLVARDAQFCGAIGAASQGIDLAETI